MTTSHAAIEIQKFIATQKFAPEAWKGRLANPSDAAMCRKMEAVLNDMAIKVLPLVQANAKASQIKSAMALSLRSTSNLEFDTEEREFICDEIERLGQIAGVKVGNVLNRWLYGNALGSLINLLRGPAKK